MCIRDEKEGALREVQVAEQRQHVFLGRTYKKEQLLTVILGCKLGRE